jgi:hypothetical protein
VPLAWPGRLVIPAGQSGTHHRSDIVCYVSLIHKSAVAWLYPFASPIFILMKELKPDVMGCPVLHGHFHLMVIDYNHY